MTKNDQIQLFLLDVSDYYGRKMTKGAVEMMADDLGDLSLDEIKSACSHYRKTAKYNRMPLPAEIIEIAKPQLADADIANKLCGDIVKSINSHGKEWTGGYFKSIDERYWITGTKRFSSWEESATDALGEFGMKFVSTYGWARLCEEYYVNSGDAIFMAQLRRSIESSYRMAKTGDIDRKFELPTASKPSQIGDPTRGGMASMRELMGDTLSTFSGHITGREIKTNDHVVTSDETTK